MIHSTLNDPDGLNRHFRLCPSLNPVAGLHMVEDSRCLFRPDEEE
jgi:hypothetical protein